jgi:hypothetical protein
MAMSIYREFMLTAIVQGNTPRRLKQIAGATALAAFSGWLAMDYLSESALPVVASAAAVPVAALPVSAEVATTRVSAVPGPSIGNKTVRRVARSRAETHPETLAAPLSAVAASSPGVDAGPAETTGQPVTAQPLAGLPPPVAMLMAACALQKKLAASVQVR